MVLLGNRLTQISEKGPTTVKTTGRRGVAVVAEHAPTSVAQNEKPAEATPKLSKLHELPLGPDVQVPNEEDGARTRPLTSPRKPVASVTLGPTCQSPAIK